MQYYKYVTHNLMGANYFTIVNLHMIIHKHVITLQFYSQPSSPSHLAYPSPPRFSRHFLPMVLC
jgi:hypothetical protein